MLTRYEPDAEAARLAPNAVCNVASRVVWLRNKLSEFTPDVQAALALFVAPMPFEKELLSGRMEDVDRAIKELGKPLI